MGDNVQRTAAKMPDIRTLSSDIREEACRLGFFKTGIAAARALPWEERFESWLQRGFQGTMRYIERQAFQRKNPALLFPDARSLLIVAMNYFTGYPLAQEPMKGKISRYAWGDDYHAVVGNRLEMLLRFIQSRVPSAQGRWYVDAGPVMEKAWGAQTALGWMGKHTNLITRDRGSWFFIGAILLDVELEYDSPEKDFCGSCRRCLRACPTGAIVAPYVLDARLCISYLTIEYRGVIPRPLRSRIGSRIYGCDDCQEVCPWNRFAETTPEKEWLPRQENLMPELAPLVHITPGEFARRFSKSPVLRATRDGFVRNVVVALGNSRSEDSVPALEEALRDGSPLVRAHAAWALGECATERARRFLQTVRVEEADALVLDEIAAALGPGGGAHP
jgi:epoxyqueuosine reductase